MTCLSNVSKKELIDELTSREGVACFDVSKDETYDIRKLNDCGNGNRVLEKYYGPIKIITVVD